MTVMFNVDQSNVQLYMQAITVQPLVMSCLAFRRFAISASTEVLQTRSQGQFFCETMIRVMLQLRNLLWATSKHDLYFMHDHCVKHWNSLTRQTSEVSHSASLKWSPSFQCMVKYITQQQ